MLSAGDTSQTQRRKQDEGKQWAMVCCADSYQESEGLETRTDPKSDQYHWRWRGLAMTVNKAEKSGAENKYWFGQKVHLDFPVWRYGKTQVNFLANKYLLNVRIHFFLWKTQQKCFMRAWLLWCTFYFLCFELLLHIKIEKRFWYHYIYTLHPLSIEIFTRTRNTFLKDLP